MIIPDELLELTTKEIVALLVLQATVGLIRVLNFYSSITDEELSISAAEWLANNKDHVLKSTVEDLQDEIRKQLHKQLSKQLN